MRGRLEEGTATLARVLEGAPRALGHARQGAVGSRLPEHLPRAVRAVRAVRRAGAGRRRDRGRPQRGGTRPDHPRDRPDGARSPRGAGRRSSAASSWRARPATTGAGRTPCAGSPAATSSKASTKRDGPSRRRPTPSGVSSATGRTTAGTSSTAASRSGSVADWPLPGSLPSRARPSEGARGADNARLGDRLARGVRRDGGRRGGRPEAGGALPRFPLHHGRPQRRGWLENALALVDIAEGQHDAARARLEACSRHRRPRRPTTSSGGHGSRSQSRCSCWGNSTAPRRRHGCCSPMQRPGPTRTWRPAPAWLRPGRSGPRRRGRRGGPPARGTRHRGPP